MSEEPRVIEPLTTRELRAAAERAGVLFDQYGMAMMSLTQLRAVVADVLAEPLWVLRQLDYDDFGRLQVERRRVPDAEPILERYLEEKPDYE